MISCYQKTVKYVISITEIKSIENWLRYEQLKLKNSFSSELECILVFAIFRDYWFVAQVVLIFKPGKAPQSAISYWPISLLPLLPKVMEIIILKRLDHIIGEKNNIPDHQFGFRKHHSIVEQVNRVYTIV